MGWSFSSISILKNDITQDQIEKHIVQFMRKNGFLLTVGSTGAVLTTGIDRAIRIISSPSSKWITILDDEMPGKQQDKLSASFSKKFKTYILSLTNVDSDFMEILLYNQVKSDKAFVGIPYDMEDEDTIARGNPEAWKEIAKDPESLISQFSENHVFSEEILFSLESQTGISRKDILQIPHSTEEGQQPSVTLLMHFASGNVFDPYVTDAPTILEAFGNVIPNMQSETRVSFINRGGISTGLDIWILGPSVEKKIISIDEIELICRTDPRKETGDDDNIRKVTGKTCLVNSSYGENSIYAHFPDFVFPEGIKPGTGVNSLKYMSIEFRHLIEVKFIPRGLDTEDIPEIYVIAHPLSNNEGCAKTYPSCSVITCSRKHGQVEYCFQCSSYPCARYDRIGDADSFISYRNVKSDFEKAKTGGLEQYTRELTEKIDILEFLINTCNDGRKKAFYCNAVNLLPLPDLREIMSQIKERIANSDIPSGAARAYIFRILLPLPE